MNEIVPKLENVRKSIIDHPGYIEDLFSDTEEVTVIVLTLGMVFAVLFVWVFCLVSLLYMMTCRAYNFSVLSFFLFFLFFLFF